MPRVKRIKRPARPHPPSDDSDDDSPDEHHNTTHPPSDDSDDDDDDDDSPDELATTAHTASDDSPDELATTAHTASDDSPDELATTAHAAAASDDSDDDELAELRAKEAQRRARRRAAKARYRARHPERVADQKRRYRTRHPQRIAAQKRRYRKKCKGIPLTDEDDEMAKLRTSQPRYRTRSSVQKQRDYEKHRADQKRRDYEKHRAERLAYYRRYYQTRTEWIRRYQSQYHQSERGRAVWPKRRKLCALAHARGPAERERTAEKLQALGPLSLTVSVEDFMQGFCDSLSPAQEAMTITDMDSGALHPLDSSCDLWDDGRGFLDNLLQELSDLPSPSDDSLYALLRYLGPWSPQDSDFDLEDFFS